MLWREGVYIPRKTAKNHKNKERPRWEFGFWLGRTRGGEVIIGTSEGVIKTRTEHVKGHSRRKMERRRRQTGARMAVETETP